jgi:hypothetical protein
VYFGPIQDWAWRKHNLILGYGFRVMDFKCERVLENHVLSVTQSLLILEE